MTKAALSLAFLVSILFACSTKVGDSCDDEGSTDVCVDGAICTKAVDNRLTCQKVCKEQTDCPTNASCVGVSKGSSKACRPNSN